MTGPELETLSTEVNGGASIGSGARNVIASFIVVVADGLMSRKNQMAAKRD
jgi:hypothetical protein